MERAGVESPRHLRNPLPTWLLLPSKRPLGGKQQEKKKPKGMGSGGLERDTAEAPRDATESAGQKDRHTFFFRHALTVYRHDTGTNILSLPPFPSDLDPFWWDYQNRKVHPSAPAQGPHPAPQIREQRLQALRSVPPFSGSRRPWACSPWILRPGDGEPAPTPYFGFLSSPFQ